MHRSDKNTIIALNRLALGNESANNTNTEINPGLKARARIEINDGSHLRVSDFIEASLGYTYAKVYNLFEQCIFASK
jgi:hypothetical protein